MRSEILSVVQKAKKDREVLAAILFGSYVREEQFSDIDICLVLQPDHYQKLELSTKKLTYMKEISNNIEYRSFNSYRFILRPESLKKEKYFFQKMVRYTTSSFKH